MDAANTDPQFFAKMIQSDFHNFTVRFNYCKYRKTQQIPLNFTVFAIIKSACKIAGKIWFIVGKF